MGQLEEFLDRGRGPAAFLDRIHANGGKTALPATERRRGHLRSVPGSAGQRRGPVQVAGPLISER
jgi:hypothetical protein